MEKYVDVHAHLNEFADYENFLNKNKNILVINNGLNSESNRITLEMAKKFSNLKAALGIHPNEVDSVNIDRELEFIRKNKNNIIAIGEIGLDKKFSTYINEQIGVFESLIELSLSLNLPIIVHSRLAEIQTIKILEEHDAKKVVMHSFTGNLKLIQKILDNGWMLSIPSIVEYSDQFKKTVILSDIKNLLTETDTPYLGNTKDIGPVAVKDIVKKISELKKIPEEEIRKTIFGNYETMFVKK
ncbi:TatD family hydrolase [Candidatus Woesearchaeota archaeon]|nr:TatD family hydrolase [Candidatus Woesearchaeota archaeon]